MKTLFSFGHAVAANDVPLNNVGLPLSWFLNDFWFVTDNLGKIISSTIAIYRKTLSNL